jgi:hypothetical protein
LESITILYINNYYYEKDELWRNGHDQNENWRYG